jgi:CDP-paratose 2-epimerase
MSIDQTRHSLFGVSKVASDVLVQEYGRYFGIYTACFRGGCLSGPSHSGTELHGFLSYLMKCAITGDHYTIFGYKGKQVRDTIHSYDLVNMFWHFYQKPKTAEVYNAGGGRDSNFSILEAIALCEEITGRKVNWSYTLSPMGIPIQLARYFRKYICGDCEPDLTKIALLNMTPFR